MPDTPRSPEQLTPPIPKHIARLLKRLGWRRTRSRLNIKRLLDFIKNRGETIRPDPETFTALQEILLDSSRRVWREQTVAAWALSWADLTLEQQKAATVALVYRLDYGGETKGNWYGQNVAYGGLNSLGWGAVGGGLLLFGWGIAITQDPKYLSAMYYLCGFLIWSGLITLCLTPLVPFVIAGKLTRRGNMVRQEAARTLGILGRAEAVPALLRASHNQSFYTEVGLKALLSTLPALTFEEHYGTLSSDVVPNLCRLLKRLPWVEIGESNETPLALLRALAAVGDARAIAPLTDMIEMGKPFEAAQRKVHEEEQRVLAILAERAARETEKTTLLRGAEAPVLPHTLLRPYEGTTTTEPQELLRAVNGEEEG